jgi:hypothetical protein
VVGLDVEPTYTPTVGKLFDALDEAGLDVNLLAGDAARATGEGERDPTAGEPAFSVGGVDVHPLNPADWPGAGREGGEDNDTLGPTANQGSAVLYLGHDAGDGLLTGDVEAVSAHHVAAQHDLSGAEWLQLPHHGSWRGGGYVLDAARPTAVGVPGGDGAGAGLGAPHSQRLADAAAVGVEATTLPALDGWASFGVGPQGVEVSSARGEPGTPLAAVEATKGAPLDEHLAETPEPLGGLVVQTAERVADGRVAETTGEAAVADADTLGGGLYRAVTDDDAVREAVAVEAAAYAESGDAASFVRNAADAVRDYDPPAEADDDRDHLPRVTGDRLAATLDEMVAAEDRLVGRIERRNRQNEATRDAADALAGDDRFTAVVEARDDLGADPDSVDPETLKRYLRTADELLDRSEVDRERVSVEGLVDAADDDGHSV